MYFCHRYVTQDRLKAMLDYEYLQVSEPLKSESLADTLMAVTFRKLNAKTAMFCLCQFWRSTVNKPKPH